MSDSRSIARQTPRRTPIHSRSYLGMAHPPMHQSPHHSGTHTPHQIAETGSLTSEDNGLIYGTNISTHQVTQSLERFILNFEQTKLVENQFGQQQEVTQKTYLNQLNEMDILESTIFQVKATDIKQHDRELYYQFIYFPAEMISCFDYVLKGLYDKHFIQPVTNQNTKYQKQNKKDRLMMGIKNLDELTQLKKLNPKSINKLISFKGIVIRTSEVYPEMKSALFRCTNCKTESTVYLQNAKVQQPTECRQCKLRNTLQIIHNLCGFTDKQYIKFQQLPQYVPEGQTPHSITIIAYDNNVDGIRPGDRVEVVGIYRTQSVKIQKSRTNLKSVFNTYIDLISFKLIQENRFRTQGKMEFNDYDKQKFNNMAKGVNEKDVIQTLVDSFAPSIYGHDEIKKGILAQLFGGTKKQFLSRARFRSDVNICLLGDPSTAKSQLLQQVYKIAPRGIYTSGRGSSAVGLTANVRKDPQTRQFVLESGALVLSDQGICCIDEFDKMDENSRTILLQAMQQQTISIAKAGIVCQLNSRTAILAAANPVNSKYDPKKSVIENINLSPALLSRFDLIYIMLDVPNDISDRKLASHILDMYSNKNMKDVNIGTYSKEILAKYISYARQYVTPVINEQAAKKLQSAYLQMRSVGVNRKTITATPRQLESLIRISQAFAKMRLSSQVTIEDVDEAFLLVKSATQQAATDPNTGIIDMDIITTGKTTATKLRIQKIKASIKELIKANIPKYQKTNTASQLLEQLEKQKQTMQGGQKMSIAEVGEALYHLKGEDFVAVFGNSKHNVQFRLAKSIE